MRIEARKEVCNKILFNNPKLNSVLLVYVPSRRIFTFIFSRLPLLSSSPQHTYTPQPLHVAVELREFNKNYYIQKRGIWMEENFWKFSRAFFRYYSHTQNMYCLIEYEITYKYFADLWIAQPLWALHSCLLMAYSSFSLQVNDASRKSRSIQHPTQFSTEAESD